ncbi:MAG: type II secretion system protein GspM, partial [Porticoccaceae bacterium]
MRVLIANLQDKFAQLQQREKLFVTVGAALVVMAIIYSTLLPQLTKNNQLANQQADLQADLLWLQQQQAVVARLANSCASSQASVEPAKTVLTRLIRRNQLRLQNLRENSQGLVLR